MINIHGNPSIAGLQFRHFLGEIDFPRIAAVLMASEAADQSERVVTAQDIDDAYKNMTNCDPYRDIIFAEINGEMVGYSRGWWQEESPSLCLYVHNGFLVPEWRRRGIGQAMLAWMEQHLCEMAAAHPDFSERYFQVNTTQFQKGTAILLEHSGYLPARYFYLMVRPSLDDIHDFPLPAGIEIRPAVPDHYPAIWESVNEAAQDEWGYQSPTDDDYHEWLESPNFQPELWQIAWDKNTNRVVGHVLTYIYHAENRQINRKRGYTEGIGVVRSWRRRGLARALISKSLQAQKAAGMTESALIADRDSASGATLLYESCGFQVVKCDTLYRKPMP